MQISINEKWYFNGVKQFEHEFPNCKFIYGNDDIKNSDVVFGAIGLDEFSSFERLKWLQTGTSGVDYYINEKFPEDVFLTSATGGYNLAISEYMLATTLSLFQNLHLYRDCQNEHKWQYQGGVSFVHSKKFLIVGLGNIGMEYAKLIKALGGYVIGIRRNDLNKPNFVDELYLIQDLMKLLPIADVVAITTPSTSETKKMIDKDVFSAMKKSAIILNIGRGNIIDTNHLLDALLNEEIKGAILDVTDPEPLPSDNQLWNMKNVIITPHISGGFSSYETKDAIISIFKENLCRFLENKELINKVDFEKGYASNSKNNY